MLDILGAGGQVSISAVEYAELVRQNEKMAAFAKALQKEINSMTDYMAGTDVRVSVKQIADALDINLTYPPKKESADGAGVYT